MKCGNRPNFIYPINLITFTLGRRIIEFIMSEKLEYSGKLVLSFLIFLSEFIGGIFVNIFCSYEKKKSSTIRNFKIKLITSSEEIEPPDTILQIFLLIFIASGLDFIGSIIRRYIIPLKISNEIEIFEHSVRSLQIFFSSILCFILLKIKIAKHQIFSLIIIFGCTGIISFIEFSYFNYDSDDSDNNNYKSKIISIFLACYSCLQRACMDNIHKYLFERDFLNPYKLLIIQGGINIFLTIPFYFLIFDENNKEITDLFDSISENYFLIILILLYLIVSIFKNIYIVITINIFSPMTRALCESCFDCFIIPYYLLKDFRDKNINYFWIFFFIILLVTIIINFFSFVYNEFIILYCFGMEYNAHKEIIKRGESFNESLNMSKFARDTIEQNNKDNNNVDNNTEENNDNNYSYTESEDN